MRVTYQPDGGPELETEVPCEADPRPFALRLIQQGNPDVEDRSWLEDQLRRCTADGSPL